MVTHPLARGLRARFSASSRAFATAMASSIHAATNSTNSLCARLCPSAAGASQLLKANASWGRSRSRSRVRRFLYAASCLLDAWPRVRKESHRTSHPPLHPRWRRTRKMLGPPSPRASVCLLASAIFARCTLRERCGFCGGIVRGGRKRGFRLESRDRPYRRTAVQTKKNRRIKWVLNTGKSLFIGTCQKYLQFSVRH